MTINWRGEFPLHVLGNIKTTKIIDHTKFECNIFLGRCSVILSSLTFLTFTTSIHLLKVIDVKGYRIF